MPQRRQQFLGTDMTHMRKSILGSHNDQLFIGITINGHSRQPCRGCATGRRKLKQGVCSSRFLCPDPQGTIGTVTERPTSIVGKRTMCHGTFVSHKDSQTLVEGNVIHPNGTLTAEPANKASHPWG